MTRPLWTLDEILQATGGDLDLTPPRADGPAGLPPAAQGTGSARADGATITGISIDSRTLAPGDLFVPLTDARDGHDFVTAAFARGAAAALVRQGYGRKAGDGVLIRVPASGKADDVLAALERIGIAARGRLPAEARVVAVTGSAGKTGTTAMLRACLATCGRVHAPDKSFNNHWGVPLTLARMPADTEYGVFEIGMNHAGEISPLTRMVRPHVAIITNVLPVHVGNFPDGIEGVAKAKAEIFEGLEAGGVAIIPKESSHYDLLKRAAEAAGAQVRSFGHGGDAEAPVGEAQWIEEAENPSTHVSAELWVNGSAQRVSYDLGTVGRHIVTNSLAMLLALEHVGCLSKDALRPLANVRPSQGRGQRTLFKSANLLLIDESYNANPRSMREAIAVVGMVPREQHQRRVVVMGDMLELGASAEQFHLELDKSLDLFNIDLVFTCGPMMKHLFDRLPQSRQGAWSATSAGLIEPVLDALKPGDVVMVKGSLGSRMAPIVEAIKKRFAGGPSSV